MEEVTERVIGQGPVDRRWAVTRAARLKALASAHLCVPHRIVMRRDGAVVAAMPTVDGVDLEQWRAARGPCSLGEAVTVAEGVGEALAAMHERGLVHGDLSPSNVMVGGTVTVVDVMTGPACPGTPGMVDPARPDQPTWHDDVYAWGALVRSMVDDAGRDVVDAWSAPLCGPREDRPSARVAIASLRALAEPAPLDIPDTIPAAAPQSVRTWPDPQARWWRVRQRAASVGTVASAGLAAVAVAWAVAVALPVVTIDRSPQASASVVPWPEYADRGADRAAVDLTLARYEAVRDGDLDALLATTVDNSTARAQAKDAAPDLMRAQWNGLDVDGIEASVIASQGRRATVAVHYDVASHTVSVDGEEVEVPRQSFDVHLDLLWSEVGWRVERSRPAP